MVTPAVLVVYLELLVSETARPTSSSRIRLSRAEQGRRMFKDRALRCWLKERGVVMVISAGLEGIVKCKSRTYRR